MYHLDPSYTSITINNKQLSVDEQDFTDAFVIAPNLQLAGERYWRGMVLCTYCARTVHVLYPTDKSIIHSGMPHLSIAPA